MIGGFWPVLNRIMTACIWMGIQTYWGGQAVKIVLSAVIGPKYAFTKNTLPLSANVDTCSLVSFFIFLIIFCPMLLIRPERLQTPLKVSSTFIVSLDFIDWQIDRLCHDSLQHLRHVNLGSPYRTWSRDSHKFSSRGNRKRFKLECCIRHTSHPRSMEWWHPGTIR